MGAKLALVRAWDWLIARAMKQPTPRAWWTLAVLWLVVCVAMAAVAHLARHPYTALAWAVFTGMQLQRMSMQPIITTHRRISDGWREQAMDAHRVLLEVATDFQRIRAVTDPKGQHEQN